MGKKRRRNIYKHEVDLTGLNIPNMAPERFREHLEKIRYRGYKVEDLADGRQIVITKPGGKFSFGNIRREDFMVWIYNPKDLSLWLISHKDILNDLKMKGEHSPTETIEIINALEKVLHGADPNDIIASTQLTNPIGEIPETLLKAYKWIWGQEDCNYPDGKGRLMSWEGWKKEDGEWIKTGDGIADLRAILSKKIEN